MSKNALNNTREGNFPEWYQEVVSRADLAENSCVRGCMIIKPYGYAIWENIKNILDKKIKEFGVQNAYFPLLIPLGFLEKEAEHVEGFAKETAVITHHRLVLKEGKLVPDGELEEPYVVRPTSETIIGNSVAKWIKSYRDLPFKINQWANVMRWEMRPRVFLRSSEFLWQEGHTFFKTEEEAEKDAMTILTDAYRWLFNEFLAISGIVGKKTEDEKFPGAVNTYTIESMMQDGKALQSCTTHNLGQNFTKALGIKFTNENMKEQYAYSASWGLSTRTIGALVMTHSDDDGLVLPPKIAPYKVVIIPVIHSEENKANILEYCEKIKGILKENCYLDTSQKEPADKKWDWIRKGVPIRVEIGMKEVESDSIFYVKRDKLNEKKVVSLDEFSNTYKSILEEMQDDLLKKSNKSLYSNIVEIKNIGDIPDIFENKSCFVSIDKNYWGNNELKNIMEKYNLSYRCMPFEIENKVIIARSY